MDDLHTFALDLEKAGLTIGMRLVPVVHRGANNIVRDARENAPGADGTGPARRYPSTITYDLEFDDGVGAIIGPDREINGQAKLGNIFEYHPERGGRPHLEPALDREADNFERYVADVAGVIP